MDNTEQNTPLLAPKLERRLRGLIYHHADGLISDEIKEEFFGDDKLLFDSYHYLCNFRRTLRDRKSDKELQDTPEVWREFNVKSYQIARDAIDASNATDAVFFHQVEQKIYDNIVSFFSNLTVNEAQTLTTRQRRQRVRDIQNGKAEDFKEISLQEYLPHFIRYLCNARSEDEWQKIGWPQEDWDSDAIMIVRGHLISQSLRSGKGVHLDGHNVEEVKAQAAKYIPKEGDTYTRIALSMVEGLDQEDLPDVWRVEESDHNSVVMHAELAATSEAPQATILHADNNYILMQLENLSAALAFGSRDWCITYGHWETYSDNFLMICDAHDGERYGIHFADNQFVDTADQHIDLQSIFKKYASVTLDMEPVRDVEGFTVTEDYRRMMEKYEGLERHFIPVFINAIREALDDPRLHRDYLDEYSARYTRLKQRFVDIFSTRFSDLCAQGSATALRSFLDSVVSIGMDDVRKSLLMEFKLQDTAKALSIVSGPDEEFPGQIIASYAEIQYWGEDEISGIEYLREAGVINFQNSGLVGNHLRM